MEIISIHDSIKDNTPIPTFKFTCPLSEDDNTFIQLQKAITRFENLGYIKCYFHQVWTTIEKDYIFSDGEINEVQYNLIKVLWVQMLFIK